MWGAIAIARRSQEPLPPTTETRLGDFAELAAQAISNAEAREQLAASRARIVQAGDQERRRIERNLHDGAQQRLVALALSLRMAQTALAEDPRAADLLAQASGELQLTLEELRELARGIHPAVLSDRGLAAALEALAGRCAVPVDLELPQERLPEQVEATSYYLVAESLTNVAKYAEASEASVIVRREGDRLLVEVRDDGVGGADIERGTGLRGLADRVEALHGTLRIESPAGGGTLVARLDPARLLAAPQIGGDQGARTGEHGARVGLARLAGALALADDEADRAACDRRADDAAALHRGGVRALHDRCRPCSRGRARAPGPAPPSCPSCAARCTRRRPAPGRCRGPCAS